MSIIFYNPTTPGPITFNINNTIIVFNNYFSIVNDNEIIFDIEKYVTDREESIKSNTTFNIDYNSGNVIGFVQNVEYMILVMNSQFEQTSAPISTATFLFDKA